MKNGISGFAPASLRSFHRDVRGLSTVEYVIILVVVAVMAIGTWKTFGKRVTDQVKSSSQQIEALDKQQ